MLVLSPDAGVRDDIARVLLAVNANFQIETADPAKYAAPSGPNVKPFEMVVMHDCYVPGVKAASRSLYIRRRPRRTESGSPSMERLRAPTFVATLAANRPCRISDAGRDARRRDS